MCPCQGHYAAHQRRAFGLPPCVLREESTIYYSCGSQGVLAKRKREFAPRLLRVGLSPEILRRRGMRRHHSSYAPWHGVLSVERKETVIGMRYNLLAPSLTSAAVSRTMGTRCSKRWEKIASPWSGIWGQCCDGRSTHRSQRLWSRF